MGTFIVAYNYVAYAGWSAGLIRVPMAFGSFLPISGAIMLLVFFLGHHELFHWTHEGLTDPTSILISESALNQNQIPRWGLIVSLVLTGGFGYAPLVGSEVNAIICGGVI